MQAIRNVWLICGNCQVRCAFSPDQLLDKGRLRCTSCNREMNVRRVSYLLQMHNTTLATYQKTVEQLSAEGEMSEDTFTAELVVYGKQPDEPPSRSRDGLPRVL